MSKPLMQIRQWLPSAWTVSVAAATSGPLSALAQIPLAPPFEVFDEAVPRQQSPAVARDARGNFVVVWADSASGAIVARRFDASGAPLDAGFRVSTPPSGRIDMVPDVAVDAVGNVVIVWTGRIDNRPFRLLVDSPSIYARRYSADGHPSAPEFAVQTGTAPFVMPGAPAVAMDADGDFVVAWEQAQRIVSILGVQQPSQRRDIVMQRFSRLGLAAGPLQVAGGHWALNLDLGGPFLGPLGVVDVELRSSLRQAVDVAMDDDGDVVVAWAGGLQSSIGNDYAPIVANIEPTTSTVFVRRFDRDGKPSERPDLVATALAIETEAVLFQVGGRLRLAQPRVAMDRDGDFVVAWTEYQGNQPARLLARSFDRTARPRGRKFEVTTDIASSSQVAVASAADGRFAVSWQGPGLESGIFGRWYAQDGAASGPALAVSEGVPGQHGSTNIASDPAGNLAVVWISVVPGRLPMTLRVVIHARLYAAP